MVFTNCKYVNRKGKKNQNDVSICYNKKLNKLNDNDLNNIIDEKVTKHHQQNENNEDDKNTLISDVEIINKRILFFENAKTIN
jgi:hypothetical protein